MYNVAPQDAVRTTALPYVIAEQKQIDTCTQIFQDNQPDNSALIPFVNCTNVASLQNATFIDPREEMIEGLEEQNQLLLTAMIKSEQIFDANQNEMKKTIASQAKSNEELHAALIQAEARNKELTLLLEAQSKSHNEDKERRAKILNEEIESIFKLTQSIVSCQKNLPLCIDYSRFQSTLDWDPDAAYGICISGQYSGMRYGHVPSLLLSKMDDEYKSRANQPAETFTEETIVKMTSIEDKLKSIKNEFKDS